MITQTNSYADATLEDLARKWSAIEEILPGNWPDGDMDRLVDVQGNLRQEILRRAATETGVLAAYIRAREVSGD